MPSFNIGHEEAISVLTDSFRKRDDELDSLKAELAKLREELRLTAAERDHLRARTVDREERDQLVRQQSADEQHAAKPDLALLAGQSLAKRISDPRIGRPKKILVIGGGPAGLISLHELLNPFNRPKDESLEGYQIQLYERRAEVGGVWYFEKENELAKGWHHGSDGLKAREDDQQMRKSSRPTMDSAGDMEMLSMYFRDVGHDQDDEEPKTNGQPSELPSINGNKHVNGHKNGLRRLSSSEVSNDFCWMSYPHNAPRWPSPAYEGLVGNVLPPLLEFSAEPFHKPADGLFPSMTETHEYMLQVAGPLRSHIKTCMEVTSVKPIWHPGRSAPSWAVTSIDWTTSGAGNETMEEWDCVVAAVGAFDHPYYPEDIPGLTPLLATKSSLVMHAKTYPGPRPFVNQHNKIVVVGNANSANDVAAHLAPLNSSGPLYRCIRHESNFAHLPDSRIKDVPPIANIKVSLDRATLSLTLEDGTKLDGITKLIFASGYQYDFPWLSVPSPSSPDILGPASIYGAVPHLHNATFHALVPTLAFIGLSQGSTPMPMAEIQARNVARAYFGLLALPESTDDMLATFRARAAELKLSEESSKGWRALHQVRGPPERVLTADLLSSLDRSEDGASKGLFRWDEWREGIVKTMRAAKEGELRRIRNKLVAAGGVDGGVGGVLSFGPSLGQKFNPVYGERKVGNPEEGAGRGRSLML